MSYLKSQLSNEKKKYFFFSTIEKNGSSETSNLPLYAMLRSGEKLDFKFGWSDCQVLIHTLSGLWVERPGRKKEQPEEDPGPAFSID